MVELIALIVPFIHFCSNIPVPTSQNQLLNKNGIQTQTPEPIGENKYKLNTKEIQ